jgi:cytosine/adenosine deaminase-related metal-dependent hydrolase
VFVLLALLFLLTPLPAQTLIIQRATVIDLASPKPLKDVDVVVSGGRILAVGKKIKIPPGAQIINARGKFLIPGLWDMHMHLGLPDAFFPMLVANGITGVREMFSGIPLPQIQQWRARSDVPRIVASGFLDGPLMLTAGVIPPGAIAVSTADQARYAVRLLAAGGYDFLKVYNDLPREAYFAIAQEARAIGIPFAGHVPEAVSPLEAAQAGQLSQEHLINILLACSTNEDALRAERIRVMNDDQISSDARLRILGFPDPADFVNTYSKDKADTLFAAFVSNGIWQTPTLALLHGFAYGDDLLKDPSFHYMPESWRKTAHPRDKSYMQDLSPEQFDALVVRIRALLDRHKILVRDMHRAGVEFLAGTDTSLTNPVIPGVGLHQELALLVESGFTPLEALATATRNPARYFGALNQIGTIEPGKFADLVLLDADPLADIHNTRKIQAVTMRGRYFTRADLDAMLARAPQ